jgi:hypothetical protein
MLPKCGQEKSWRQNLLTYNSELRADENSQQPNEAGKTTAILNIEFEWQSFHRFQYKYSTFGMKLFSNTTKMFPQYYEIVYPEKPIH